MFLVTYGCVIFSVIFVVRADLIDDRFRMLYSNYMKCDHSRNLNLNVSDTQIYFYDFTNNITLNDRIDTASETIRNSVDLNYNRHLIVFVPGYKCHIKRDLEELIRQTYKDVPDIYLVIVDHSAYTYENEEKIDSYSRSVQYSYYIGRVLGNFLAKINHEGFHSENIHCIGHSLGGQIIGYAGERFIHVTGKKVGRVTGLDPAGPCFTNGPIEEQIRAGVGQYVEVYHCNAGHLGTTKTLGNIDFFFNFEGKIQPNCDKDNIEETVKCYHKACVRYWAETVHRPGLYLARSCSSYKEFSESLCDDNETTIAGYHNPCNASGTFYVSTVPKTT